MPVRVGFVEIEQYNETLQAELDAYAKEECEKGQIVFYGPSFYTRWSAEYGEKPMRDCFFGKSGKKCVINRGFGSSCSEHQLYHYPTLVRPLAPKVLVYESLANGSAFGYSLEEIFELAQRVVMYAKHDFPGIHVYLVGPHPSLEMPEEVVQKREKYAEFLKVFAENTPDCSYIEIMHHPLLQRKDIYIEDGIHFNALGYQLMTQIYTEALKDELERY